MERTAVLAGNLKKRTLKVGFHLNWSEILRSLKKG